MDYNWLAWPLVLGVVSHHLFFRRVDPSVLVFLGFVLLLFSAIFAYALKLNGTMSSSGVVFAAGHAMVVELTYLSSLGLSIIAYRVSPWHPLAKYPGPVLARVTKWWMAYWIANGTRHLMLQRLHAQYGPWLRIGPNEISVNLPSAVRPIYQAMFRAPYYRGAPSDADALITTTDLREYKSRVIAWHKAFDPESQKRYRSFAQTRTTQLSDLLLDVVTGSQVDLSKWISLWATDITGDMSFSGGFETLAAGKDSEGWMEILSIGVLAVGILGQVPWMRDIVGLLPQPGPIVTFQRFTARKVREIRQDASGVPIDILGIIKNETRHPLTEAEASADAALMVVAGQDTIYQAMTAFFRYALADEKIIGTLRDELYAAFQDGHIEDMDTFTLGKLPYLDACVQETLRIIPPVAAGPPRYSGALGGSVEGRHIPPGTTVACPIFTLHRDATNFKEPDAFIPERWLKIGHQPHNVEAYMPFSAGIGMCIGKPVAIHNMKLLAASLIRRFDLSLGDDFDLSRFDASYKEHNLWLHDPLMVRMVARQYK